MAAIRCILKFLTLVWLGFFGLGDAADDSALSGCIDIDHCPKAVELINTRKKNDLGLLVLLRSLHCGYKGRQAFIRCDKLPEKLKTTVDKSALLPNYESGCGPVGTGNKIFNGEFAEIYDFPWMALFRFGHLANSSITYNGCHGNLINKDYVITAAHCLKPEYKITIILGEYDILNKTDCQNGDCTTGTQEFSIKKQHIHPNFHDSSKMNDIALIQLDRSVNYNDFIKPICLPPNYFVLYRNEPLVISGWGQIDQKHMSRVKLKASIFYNAQCTDERKTKWYGTEICAGTRNGTGACHADSGGPLMVQRTQDGFDNYYLIGIVSYGESCGEGKTYFASVPEYIEWILATIQ